MRFVIWWIRLELALLYAKRFLRPSLDVYKVKWTGADEEALRGFLTSPVGEKFQSVLMAHIQNTDHQAVGVSTPRACGYATGQRSMLATIIALSGHVPPQVDDSETEQLQRMPRYRHPIAEPGNEKPEHS